jgi:hypothetical protein
MIQWQESDPLPPWGERRRGDRRGHGESCDGTGAVTATTQGTGEVIRAGLDRLRRIILGVGTPTTHAGTGMARSRRTLPGPSGTRTPPRRGFPASLDRLRPAGSIPPRSRPAWPRRFSSGRRSLGDRGGHSPFGAVGGDAGVQAGQQLSARAGLWESAWSPPRGGGQSECVALNGWPSPGPCSQANAAHELGAVRVLEVDLGDVARVVVDRPFADPTSGSYAGLMSTKRE